MMGAFDFNFALDKLGAYMAVNAAGGTLAYGTTTARAVWLRNAEEAFATDPYHILIPYGGEINWVPSARVAIQLKTIAKEAKAAVDGIGSLLASLLDASGRPKRMIDLGGSYRLLSAAVRQPQALGMTENNRFMQAANLEFQLANVA